MRNKGVRKEANVQKWSQIVAIEGYLLFEYAALESLNISASPLEVQELFSSS
jgi:hypothetical protein